jgi:succinate-acetate transporter protein
MATMERVGRAQAWTKSGPVQTAIPDNEIAELESRSAATVGEPGAMALFGFATGTWIVGTVVSGIFAPTAYAACAPVLIVFAGLAQFVGGLFAFRRSNTFAGTAFCSYGANNVVVGFIILLQAIHLLPMQGDAQVMLGYELLSFGFISMVMSIGAARLNAVFFMVLAPLAAGFVLAGIPDVAGATAGALKELGHIGGYLLIFSAGVAYYAGSALVLNSTYKRTVLPLFGDA